MKELFYPLWVSIASLGHLARGAVNNVSASKVRNQPKKQAHKRLNSSQPTAMSGVSRKMVSPQSVDSLEKIQAPTYSPQTDPYVIFGGGNRDGVALKEMGSTFKVADRIVPVSFEAGNRLLVITGYLHIFRQERVVKRSLKVQDPGLARVLCEIGSNRIHLDDVQLDGEVNIDELKRGLESEVRALVSRSSTATPGKSKRDKCPPPDLKVAIESKEMRKPHDVVTAPTVLNASVAEPALQPHMGGTSSKGVEEKAERVIRPVKGVPHVGHIVSAGTTTKSGANGPYNTFCVTLHDGRVEIPFMGAEVERLYREHGLKIGERVQIVSMGRQPIEIPGMEKQAWKNLYQITRATS